MGIILCSGFDKSLYQKVSVAGAIEANTRFVTLHREDLPLTLGEIVEKNEVTPAEEYSANTAKKVAAEESSALSTEYHYVIFSGSRSQLDNVMRGFRRVYQPSAGSVIYAMLTSTAKTWTLKKYLNELSDEHKQIRKQRAKVKMLHEQQEEIS